jgi:[CysO sulfur-carrier protein]-S-L-cysteine hydrolase
MLKHVEKWMPEESCGLIGGRGDYAMEIIPVTNSLHSPDRFLMDGAEQLKAFLSLESKELELVGIFHSHPYGSEALSETDLQDFAYPGTVQVIWSGYKGNWQVRGYCIQDKGYRHVPLRWTM